MIEKIVNKLLDTQIKSGLLKDETIPIYRYGYYWCKEWQNLLGLFIISTENKDEFIKSANYKLKI